MLRHMYQHTSMNVSLVGEVYARHPQNKIIPLEISFEANCINWAAKSVERSGKKEIIQLASTSSTLLVLNNGVNGKISISTVVFCGRKKYVFGLISKWI